MFKNFKKIFFLFIFLIPSFALADSYLDKKIFFVEKGFDDYKREKVLATNLVLTEKFNIYVDDDFWPNLSQFEKEKLVQNLRTIATTFETQIYPNLVLLYGKEPEKGVNFDTKTTILLEKMREDVAGYFREADNFEKTLAPTSNERKMIYLNAYLVEDPIFLEDLIHEFTHLIIFNQKRNIQGVEEERWLQEILAEVTPTIFGYKEGLKRRASIFQKYPKDPLLEWQEEGQDYGTVSIFAHYLLEQYGQNFFSNLIKTKATGISAIELSANQKFDEIFRNWMIAVFLQDCTLSPKYCFKDETLKTLKIQPEVHLLPTFGESSFSVFRQIKDFEGDWQRFYGGNGDLILELDGEDRAKFDFSVVLCDKQNQCQVQVVKPNEKQEASLTIFDYSKNYSSFSVLTFSKTQTSEPEKESPTYNFSIKATFKQRPAIPTQTSTSSSPTTSVPTTTFPTTISCKQILNNLKFGMRSFQVKCLQEFLKSQGPEIYPEGLVTGYFGPLTFSAVKRFQQKYWQEILAPWGLTRDQPTGFVGQTTRAKINQLISY